MPGLDAPGTSVPPLRLRVLRRVCRALRSRHPCLLRPLRLHSLTQVPSAGPARTCVGCGRGASIRSLCKSRSDRHLSLEPFPVRLLSRLSACLLNFSGHPASRLTPSRQLSAKVRAIVLHVRLGMVAGGCVFARSEGYRGINICNRKQRTAIAAAAGFRPGIIPILLTDTSLP